MTGPPGGRTDPGADRVARWIATCGGLGYAPIPGTVTSLPVAVLVWAVAPSGASLLAAIAVVTVVGIWAAGREEARVGEKDPRSVVIDEVAGMLVTMLGHLAGGAGRVVVLFLLFRVMDVWKPFPIRRLQDLPGGVGVVTDDLLAGVYAGLLVHLARWALRGVSW